MSLSFTVDVAPGNDAYILRFQDGLARAEFTIPEATVIERGAYASIMECVNAFKVVTAQVPAQERDELYFEASEDDCPLSPGRI